MMDLSIEVGDQFKRFSKNLGSSAVVFDPMKRAFQNISEQFIQFHQRDRMRGRPGLIMRSGSAGMIGSRQWSVDGERLDDLTADVFWSGAANKYVRVHEYGATITPKRANWLVFKAADGGWVRTKSVTIPPRLGWYDAWERFAPNRGRIYDRILRETVEGMTK